MSPDGNPKVVSMSGEPIIQHGESNAWQPPHGEECIEQISNHIEAHLGEIAGVFHEIVSDTVHVDVHIVKTNRKIPKYKINHIGHE
jgi:hypothetical protein